MREVPSSASGFGRVSTTSYRAEGTLRSNITLSPADAKGCVRKHRLCDCWASADCRARKDRFERGFRNSLLVLVQAVQEQRGELLLVGFPFGSALRANLPPPHLLCRDESSIAMVTAILTLNFTKLAVKNRMALSY